MTKRKRVILISVMIIAALSFGIILFIFTRTVYWNNKYYDDNQPSKTDAEYLNVWDLRFILHSKDKDEIENLGNKVVNDSLNYNGTLTEELQGIISDHTFSYINPRDFLSENNYEITDEQFVIKETDVLRHKNKAIFFYGCEYHATYKKNGETYNYDIGYDGMPNRLYLEYDDNKWIIVTAFRP
ncbi:hypothetical protein [Ruminococcus albus]|uniref:DUF4829 domain-containing protein n=1 Tax=Ruminococcus albus (strain ATCC 27210 / DSM 20455 / JCM 14654 / NCDO 2250 / 7) TaxID=697329 RepID=E6UJK6_RUMA7|nr:hypothetical protein [Ruminococcus albus]ADU23852.1 hypothetical protein Rumal_3395 [Ruminococcus albus 7 = DSM 20455]